MAVEPAKSCMPCLNSQPCDDQIQCETIEYVSVNQTPKTKYTHSFARSAIAPHTIASDTPAKTTSNMYPPAPRISAKKPNGFLPPETMSVTDGKNPAVPKIALPSPKASPKPTSQQTI